MHSTLMNSVLFVASSLAIALGPARLNAQDTTPHGGASVPQPKSAQPPSANRTPSFARDMNPAEPMMARSAADPTVPSGRLLKLLRPVTKQPRSKQSVSAMIGQTHSFRLKAIVIGADGGGTAIITSGQSKCTLYLPGPNAPSRIVSLDGRLYHVERFSRSAVFLTDQSTDAPVVISGP